MSVFVCACVCVRLHMFSVVYCSVGILPIIHNESVKGVWMAVGLCMCVCACVCVCVFVCVLGVCVESVLSQLGIA